MNHSTLIDRRTALVRSLLAAGMVSAQANESQAAPGLLIENVNRLYPVQVARAVAPRSASERIDAVDLATR